MIKKHRKKFFLSFVTILIIVFVKLQTKNLNHDNKTIISKNEIKKTQINSNPIKEKAIEDNIRLKMLKKNIQKDDYSKDDFNQFNGNLEKAYCLIKKLKIDEILNENSRVSGFYGPDFLPTGEYGEPILNLLIDDNACPKGKFSTINAKMKNGKWNILKVNHCQRTSDKDLFIEVRKQRPLVFSEPRSNYDYPLAINGRGLFVLKCDEHYKLSRVGHFLSNEECNLLNEEKCFLINSNFKKIKVIPGESFESDSNCFSESKQCIQLISKDNLYGMELTLSSSNELVMPLSSEKELKNIMIKSENRVGKKTNKALTFERAFISC